MAMKQGLFSTIFLVLSCNFLLLFLPRGLADEADISSWCDTTPHPEPCKYLMGSEPHRLRPRNKAHFRTMCVEVALEQALYARSNTKQIGPHCRSKKKKAAWLDCDKLFDDTVEKLNTTLQALQSNSSSLSNTDAQTWLSTALTNIETCRSGPVELNVSDFISPIVSRNNLTQLISNSLAINGGLVQHQEHTDDGFPSWVSAGDRRLLRSSSLASKAKVIVAKDGSGHFKSIQAAINYATAKRVKDERVIIYIKRGVYAENIAVTNTMSSVMLVGDGLRYTIITGSRSVAAGFTTYSTATVGVDGIGFMARGITFRNTAGPQKGQAVALRSASDLSVFYACGFEGYQDTLFVHAQRQFYKTCHIYGTIDFIFGNAAVVFQSCVIYARKPLRGQVNVITAQGRGDPFQNTAISIHYCRITAAPDLKPVVKLYQTYLGRPWQQYSRTVILKSYLDSVVDPAGWLTWLNTDFALDTLYYGEYQNIGPAASTRNRVKWPGFHVIANANEASQFTVANLIAGKAWLPSTGVPFAPGL